MIPDADAFRQGIIGQCWLYAAPTEDALLLDSGATEPYQQLARRIAQIQHQTAALLVLLPKYMLIVMGFPGNSSSEMMCKYV